MCASASTCSVANNASHPNADGKNSACVCNYGFVPSITVVSGVLTLNCTCPTNFTNTSTTINNVSSSSCCPANSAPNTTNGACVCSSGFFEGGLDVSNGIWCL